MTRSITAEEFADIVHKEKMVRYEELFNRHEDKNARGEFDGCEPEGQIMYNATITSLKIDVWVEVDFEIDCGDLEINGISAGEGGYAEDSISSLDKRDFEIVSEEGNELDSDDILEMIANLLSVSDLGIPKEIQNRVHVDTSDEEEYELLAEVDNSHYKISGSPNKITESCFRLYRCKKAKNYVCECDEYVGRLSNRSQEVRADIEDAFEFFKKYDNADLWLTKAAFRKAGILPYENYLIKSADEDDIAIIEVAGKLADVKLAGEIVAKFSSATATGSIDELFHSKVYRTGEFQYVAVLHHDHRLNYIWDEYNVVLKRTKKEAISVAADFVDDEKPFKFNHDVDDSDLEFVA